ncbi:hypothetical protein BGZ46_007831, partial [Entomortierella lignicola]
SSRDRNLYQSEPRNPVSKSRRATGESVHRPNYGQSKSGSSSTSKMATAQSAPSTPRPIPKNNKKTAQQPGSMSSSYTFDEAIDNPFLPSTPPTFTPSMERTAFIKPDPLKDGSSLREGSSLKGSSTVKENLATKESSSREGPSLKGKVSTSFAEKEASKQPTTRKVITPDSFTNIDEKPPNASFMRSREGSVSSMPGPRHEDMILPAVARRIKEQGIIANDVVAYSDDYNAPLYKLPSSSISVNHPFASYDKENAASNASLAHKKSMQSILKGKDGLESHSESFNPALSSSEIPTSPKTSSRFADRKLEENPASSDGANVQDTPPTSSNNTSEITKPERPRRTRRNTNHQQEQPNSNDEYKPQRQRRPTMPENYHYTDSAGSNDQAQFVDQPSPKQRRRQQNEPRYPESAKVNNGGYEYDQNNYSQMDVNNQYDGRVQGQGRYQQNNEDYHWNPQESYGRQGGYETRQTIGFSPDANYAHQNNDGRYDAHQGRYNAQQNVYNAQQSGYATQQDARQASHYTQQNNYDAQNMGNNVQHNHYNTQQDTLNNGYYGHETSQAKARPEMVQIEMSATRTGREDVAEIDAKKENTKKKGSVCCIVM